MARVHFALGERLGLPALVERILALPRDDRWQTMARAALRDDLHGVHAQLTAQVLESTSADDSAPARIAAWEDADEELVARAGATLRGDLPRGDRRPGPAVGRACGWCAACCPDVRPDDGLGRHGEWSSGRPPAMTSGAGQKSSSAAMTPAATTAQRKTASGSVRPIRAPT